MEKRRKMMTFRKFLEEEFEKDKKFEKDFYKELEKARISLEIVYFREQAGFTQAELARRMNTSQSNIARLENPDYQKYSISVLRRVADALGVELVVTFRRKDKQDYKIRKEFNKTEGGREDGIDFSRLEHLIEQTKVNYQLLYECRQLLRSGLERRGPSLGIESTATAKVAGGDQAEA